MIRKWSFRAALFLSALTLLCWIDFGTLTYLEESEFQSEEGIDYFVLDSPSLPFLIAGLYAAFGAVFLLVAGGMLMLWEVGLRFKNRAAILNGLH